MSIAAVIGLIGTGLSVYGQVRAGMEQKRMAERNARIAEYAAGDAIARGAYSVYKRQRQTAQTVGRQRVAFAAGNIAGVTPAMIEMDTRITSDLDAAVIRHNTALEVWGLSEQAEEFRRGGKRAIGDAILGASGSILTGAFSAYGAMGNGGGGSTFGAYTSNTRGKRKGPGGIEMA